MAQATKRKNGEQPPAESAARAARDQDSADMAPAQGALIFELDFDPEGWMSERPRYWLDRGPSVSPGRLASLRRRLREAASALGPSRLDAQQPRTTEEEWIRLSEQALGPLPRPPAAEPPDARREASPAATEATNRSLEDEARAAAAGSPEAADGTA